MSFVDEGFFSPTPQQAQHNVFAIGCCDIYFFLSLLNKVYLQLKLCINVLLMYYVLMVQTCLRPVCH